MPMGPLSIASRFGGHCERESNGKYPVVETDGRCGSREVSDADPGIRGDGNGKLEGTELLIMLGLGY